SITRVYLSISKLMFARLAATTKSLGVQLSLCFVSTMASQKGRAPSWRLTKLGGSNRTSAACVASIAALALSLRLRRVLIAYLFKRAAICLKRCLLAGKVLPAANDYVAVFRVQFHAVVNAICFLAR